MRPVTARLNRRLATLFRLPYETDQADEVTPFLDEIDPALVPDDDTLVETPDGGADATRPARAKRRKSPSSRRRSPTPPSPSSSRSPSAPPPRPRPGSCRLSARAVGVTAGRPQDDRGHGPTLVKALADHGVETRLVGMVIGPTVTRYELELGPGVKVNRHEPAQGHRLRHGDTRCAHLGADPPASRPSGSEFPSARRQIVSLGDILINEEAPRATHPLEVAVERDIGGRSIMMNLAAMPECSSRGDRRRQVEPPELGPHLVLLRSTPDQVRMILVDPKRVEMGQYDRLPYLLQVVTNPKKAANALAWAVKEMERRYDLLAEVSFREHHRVQPGGRQGRPGRRVGGAADRRSGRGGDRRATTTPTSRRPSKTAPPAEYPRLPFVLVVIDKLADLMMVAARDVEESIARLAQMARAVGIHLVTTTQRPSVNVITGLIKANVPARTRSRCRP